MPKDNNPDRGDDGARAKAEMKEREAVAYGGWITWTGGECPLQRNTAGEIRVEAGEEFFDPDISDFNWRHDHKGPVPGRRIVAYRVALPAPQGDDTLEWLDVLIERLDDIARGPVYGGTASEVASALRSQAERIAALEVERDEALEGPWPKWADELRKYLLGFGVDPGDDGWDLPAQYEEWLAGAIAAETAHVEAAESLLAEAREALEPFAGLPEGWHIVAYNKTGTTACAFNAGEVERARATLSRLKPGEKGGE